MARYSYNRSVFVNSPIDDQYLPLFRAAIFAVLRCDYFVRSALEEDDSSELRLRKIARLISECRYGIHDLSRTQVDLKSGLPRFNMPFELGMFLGSKEYAGPPHDKKVCLIFEATAHSYEAYISDIKGLDIAAHGNEQRNVVIKIRNWLASNSQKTRLVGGHAIWRECQDFNKWLPRRCRDPKVDLKERDLTFGDYVNLVYEWIERPRARRR